MTRRWAPMRVLVTTYAERTHLFAMIPLAWALRAAGHDVRVAVQPAFVQHVCDAGLIAVPVGSDRNLWQLLGRIGHVLHADGLQPGMPDLYNAVERPPGSVTWEELHDGYQRQIAVWHKTSNVPMVPDLVAFARCWRPDLVLWEPLTYAGAVAARACGAAHARLLFSVDMYGGTRELFLRRRAERTGETGDPLADWLGAYARVHGAPGRTTFDEDMVTGQVTVDIVPPSLQLATRWPTLPMRYVPYGGPATVPHWLRTPPQRPRVALTLGLSRRSHRFRPYLDVQAALDDLADLDVEVVATVSERVAAELERVPSNTRLVSYVPLQALIPTCDAVVHHGGIGTLATTILNRVPQVILPWDNDGPALAARAGEQRAALVLDPSTSRPGELAGAVRRALAGEITDGVAQLHAELLATPGPADVVADLELLAAQGSAPQGAVL